MRAWYEAQIPDKWNGWKTYDSWSTDLPDIQDRMKYLCGKEKENGYKFKYRIVRIEVIEEGEG